MPFEYDASIGNGFITFKGMMPSITCLSVSQLTGRKIKTFAFGWVIFHKFLNVFLIYVL